jgi:crotonobetainyl-CoA:carnitine CoA-transferase CaiB-like acyl-CoA transferase
MIDGTRPSVDTPPPALGADTDCILTALGYAAEDIETLRKENVV